MKKEIHVLTWHIHGNYLLYLSQTDVVFYIPKKNDGSVGYSGRSGILPWPDNLVEVPAEEVKNLDLDIVLFQSKKNYLEDQYEILSPKQLLLPKVYLEHDPPREVPTDTKHIIDDPNAYIVHVTHFNNLMWDNGATQTKVIEHGVMVPHSVAWKGDKKRGIVMVNNLKIRGRRLGLDIFEKVRKKIPLDLIGIGSKELGGLGEVPYTELPEFLSQYRFFFNPIRYTSLGLSVCEAMMIGVPIVGLATTEMPKAIENGKTGIIDTDIDVLVQNMEHLLEDESFARKISTQGKKSAEKQFNIQRFTQEWKQFFEEIIAHHSDKISYSHNEQQPISIV